MLMVVTNDGKEYFLSLAMQVPTVASEDWFVKLFKNNFTPVDGSVTADFTEATFTGYSAVGIGPGSMNPPAVVANVAESTYTGPPVFTCTGGADETVYGWFLMGDSSGKTYLAQKFDTPRLMTPGAVESLDPFKIKMKTFA
jgi:hypothetical protein